jgi:hypothetical protein
MKKLADNRGMERISKIVKAIGTGDFATGDFLWKRRSSVSL